MSSDRRFPRGALIGAGVLVCTAIAAASAASIGGIGVSRVVDSVPLATRDLRFEDRPDGGVAVIEAKDNKTIHVLAPGNDGFVRIVMRGFARERLRHEQDRQIPFRRLAGQTGDFPSKTRRPADASISALSALRMLHPLQGS